MLRRGFDESFGLEAADFSPETAEGQPPAQVLTCGKGHRPSLSLSTAEGGVFCLVCFSTLVADPRAPTHHVSFALSQLELAARGPDFRHGLRTFHPHLLVSPLVRALAAADDEPLARQVIDLVADLSGPYFSSSIAGDFIARISDLLASGALAWRRRQVYTLHCLGVLLNSDHDCNPAVHIRDKAGLFSNLVVGLQLPSEEIRGEILFVLYKLCLLKATPWDDEGDTNDIDLSVTGEKLLCLSLEALNKTQNDDVRLNCVALLIVLARKGVFERSFANDQTSGNGGAADPLMQTDTTVLHAPLVDLFADAIKGPLLSSDTQVQIGALDLIFHSLSLGVNCVKQIEVLVEEGIADYVFEILRLSGNKDPLVISCLEVLSLLAIAEQVFRQRLAVGFPTLLSVLHYVAEIPLHPVQSHLLKLVWTCISDCPGIISTSQVEEITLILTKNFKRHNRGELGMLSETFALACSTFVEILKTPSARHIPKLTLVIKEASRNAIFSSLTSHENPNQFLLYSLHLLKEAYLYILEESSDANSDNKQLECSIIETCEAYLIPWLERVIDKGEDEEVVLGVLETFHVILLKGSEIQALKFAETLASSSWFSFSFGCLGLFPSEQMKIRVYVMLSSIVDRILGTDFGQPIRDAYVYLPSDPQELIYLLGQRSLHDPNLASCQCAILLILYVCSYYGERLTDGNQVLASLEQYILINSNNFSCGIADSKMLSQLVHLYGHIRGDSYGYRIPYSVEAENVVLQWISEKEWDLLSTGIHPVALKWLLQQEEIMTPLSYQILNFCKFYSSKRNQVYVHKGNIPMLEIQTIAELVVSGDNYMASLLVSLLKQDKEGWEDDIIDVVNVMEEILQIFPSSSNQFCLHGIADVLQRVYHSIHSSEIFVTCSLLVFNILHLANYETLSQDEQWLAICVKLLAHVSPKLASGSCGSEEHLVMSIFCLVLHHSTNKVLKEASRAILLNNSLASAIESIVQTACAKGPALVDFDEETKMGESLIFVLLLYFFTLKSLHAVLQEALEWQDFLQSSNEVHSLSVLCIKCHDLCRLINFGGSVIKLIASQCLVELLTRISDQTNSKNEELKCSMRYLESMMAVTEGLVFYGDKKVATNCALCISMILGWEKLGLEVKRAIKDSKWCRLVIEELAMTLAAPGFASRSFTNQHKPAAHVAVAWLKLDQIPRWMNSVFDNSCISGIVNSLSASNVTTEMVKLFRQLMARKYLNKEQVAALHHLFQVCRKQVYEDRFKEKPIEENFDKVVAIPDHTGKVCGLLINLMVSPNIECDEIQTQHEKLLEEIETFFQESAS